VKSEQRIAPGDPKQDGLAGRLAELALDDHGISCFTTPGMLDWVPKRIMTEKSTADLMSVRTEDR
jgi:hypothetical protein